MRKIMLYVLLGIVVGTLMILNKEHYQRKNTVIENEQQSIKLDNAISIMLETDDGTYVRSSSNTWPSSTQYSLDYAKSYCQNGSSFEFKNGKVMVSLEEADICYMYFKKGKAPTFYIGGSSNPSSISSTNTTVYASWDAGSITAYCISNTESCSSYTTVSSTTTSINKAHTVSSTDGIKTVYFYYKDASGNVAYVYDTVQLSKGPVLSVSQTKNGKEITVTITADEEVQSVSGWTLSSDKKTLTKTYSSSTTETITVYDLAGNGTTKTITVSLDTTGPSITLAGDGGTTISSTTTDESGVYGYCISQNQEACASKSNYTTTSTKSVGSSGTWYYYAMDNLDNISYETFTVEYVGGCTSCNKACADAQTEYSQCVYQAAYNYCSSSTSMDETALQKCISSAAGSSTFAEKNCGKLTCPSCTDCVEYKIVL